MVEGVGQQFSLRLATDLLSCIRIRVALCGDFLLFRPVEEFVGQAAVLKSIVPLQHVHQIELQLEAGADKGHAISRRPLPREYRYAVNRVRVFHQQQSGGQVRVLPRGLEPLVHMPENPEI